MIVAAIVLVNFFSCRTTKPGSPQPTKDPTVYKGVTSQDCAVEMAFGSYGSGIDDSAYKATMLFIARRNQTYTSTNLGREGETRLCLPLGGLKKKEKNAFIDTLKKIAKAGSLVSVSIR